jgi:hypothetical protein
VRPLTPGTLRQRLFAANHFGPTWTVRPRSTAGRLLRGLPTVLPRENIAGHVSPNDLAARGIDLSLAPYWRLVGPDTLEPVE